LSELREDGYLSVAKSELMRDNCKAENEKWNEYNENLESSEFHFNAKEGMNTTTFISGSRGVGKSDVAMRIVDELKNDGVVCIVFDPSRDWVQRSSVSQYFTVKPYSDLPIPESNTVIDISQLTPMQQQGIVELFCKNLFEFQLDKSTKKFYIVLEEAQLFFPLNSLRSLKTQNSMRILTVGRNFSVSLCAISQFPALIDKELVKHAGQIFIGYTSETNTMQYWKGILGKKAEDLKTLQNGEFVYYCRNKINKIQIEPYDNNTFKTEIPQLPEPEPTEPIISNQTSIIPIANLFILLGFAVLVLYSLRGM